MAIYLFQIRSPLSSHARKIVSMSTFVCAALTQKRTREVAKGVAGYATTTGS